MKAKTVGRKIDPRDVGKYTVAALAEKLNVQLWKAILLVKRGSLGCRTEDPDECQGCPSQGPGCWRLGTCPLKTREETDDKT